MSITTVFTEAEHAYLAQQWLGRLVTLEPDGSPQARPVGFTVNTERATIDVGGYHLARSRKFRNVTRDSRVAFVVDDLASVDPWRPRGVEIRGRAEALPADDTGPPLIRIHPRRVP
ncbi:PPOX class F420-dependent oxidoreductase [Salinactinospora qingdaonensis]|uniref:PPOX class F420-dependent oxidoreductase n=1 Tax=Salinactinospora qingdaonensis TaxID=702744 RepID=A0ABP7GHZ2_9ACTN